MKIITFLLTLLFTQSFATAIILDQTKTPLLSPFYKDQKTVKLKLDNGLEAYLISNPLFEQSGAAVVVEAGGWDDPDNLPGLAHFVEHALFLGTVKYPNETDFSSFINERGGQSNAYTTFSQTAFVFSVDNSSFEQSFDRFAQFFIAPLFSVSGLDREKVAIDQEYHLKKKSDSFRELMVMSQLATKNHPFEKFIAGNLETLKPATRQDVVDWYTSHYSSDKMHLIVYSTLPLDALQKLVEENFSKVARRTLESTPLKTRATSDLFDKNYIYIDPIKNSRTMNLVWELPSKFSKMLASQPETAICSILGYEGSGSLALLLKKQGLATDVECGAMRLNPDIMLFVIQIELTDTGLIEKERVVGSVFQAIRRIQKQGISKELFDDIQAAKRLERTYQMPQDTFDELMTHTENIVNEGIETYPEETLIPSHYDQKALQTLADALTVDEARIHIIAPKSLTKVKFTEVEPWLQTPYATIPIPEATLNQWKNAPLNPELVLPKQNLFLPKNLKVLDGKGVEEAPELIASSDSLKIWRADDDAFRLPNIWWKFAFLSPKISLKDAESIAMADLWTALVNRELMPLLYDAKMGLLNGEVALENGTITVTIDGPNEHALDLLDKVLVQFKTANFTKSNFEIQKEALKRKYKDFYKEGSLKRASESFRRVLWENFPTEAEKERGLKNITFERFLDFHKTLREALFVRGLLFGDVSSDDGEKIKKALTSFIKGPYKAGETERRHVITLPSDKGPFYLEECGKADGNSVILGIEDEGFDFTKEEADQVIAASIQGPFFDTLRTKQQTGYIASSYTDEREETLWQFFAVQSNTHSVKDLLFRFEQFIEGFVQNLEKEGLTEEKFNAIKSARLSLLKKPAKNTKEMGERLYAFAFDHEGDFKRREKMIEALENLTWEETVEHAKVLLGRSNRRRMAVLFRGELSGPSLNWTRINGVKALKEQGLY